VQAATWVLDVTDSGSSMSPTPAATRGAAETIRQVHLASRGTDGDRHVHAELTSGHGLVVGHGTVALLMARARLTGFTGAPTWRRARPDLLATDLVARRLAREGTVSCAVEPDVFRAGGCGPRSRC
jgi:hypothetical protein